MRRMAVLALVVAACTGTGVTTTTVDPILPPPNPNDSTSMPNTSSTVVAEGRFIEPIIGHLPDGTPYTIYLETTESEELVDINGWIMLEIDEAIWAPELQFFAGPHGHEPTFANGIYTIPAGPDWHVVMTFHEGAIAALGADAESVITESIQGGAIDGDPVLEVAAPFRWANQQDPTGPFSVAYETIVVEPGCSVTAVACTRQETLQVLPKPSYEASGVVIESSLGRSLSDPFYLDRGPLAQRSFPDVIWTGQEMVVWGGFKNEVVWHTDGAAYDPESDSWRMLAESPLSPNTRSFALWVGDEVVVISREGTFGYDLHSDLWHDIADRIAVPDHDPVGIAIDGTIYAWATPFVMELDRDIGEWHRLPDPLPPGDIWYTSFRNLGGRLLLTAAGNGACPGRRFLVWDGGEWDELPGISFGDTEYADCSNVDQVGVVDGHFAAWGLPDTIARVFEESSSQWVQAGHTGFSGIEGPSGPVVVGDRLLIPEWRRGVLFDPSVNFWRWVDLPGQADASYMVWTGAEVLAWSGFWQDAWRWTPPE